MIGQTISHYRILEKLGEGGTGEVDTGPLERRVALRFLSWEMQQDPRQRFLRQARSAAALDHAYVCHIYEMAKRKGSLSSGWSASKEKPSRTDWSDQCLTAT